MAFKELELLLTPDGKFATLVRREAIKTVNVEDLASALSQSAPHRTPILPPGCKAYSHSGSMHVYAVERPPSIVPLKYWGTDYRISLPFIQAWLGFYERGGSKTLITYYISCTTTPLRDITDTLYCVPLPNTYNNGAVCMGSAKVEGTTVWEISQSFLDKYLGMNHNDDLHTVVPTELAGNDSNNWGKVLTKWAELSSKNPLVGLTFKYSYLATADSLLTMLERSK